MHRTVRWCTCPRPCEPIGSGRPCFLRTAGGPGARGDAEKQSSIEDSSRRPRARSKRPSCSTGGRGTTCGTKDTRPSRAPHTHTVRPPSVSPSGGLCVSPIFLSARAALGVLGHARSDAEFLRTSRDSFGHFASRLFVYLRLSALLEYIHARHATGTHRPPRGVAQRRDAGRRAGRRDTMTPAKRPSTRTRQTPIQSLDDLQPDPLNANRGTDRGREVLRRSLHTYGAGRSIVIDTRGRILGGHKTVEQAKHLGLPITVVPTTGQELVVVQRVDLDARTDPRAQELTLADNRVAELDLDWDIRPCCGSSNRRAWSWRPSWTPPPPRGVRPVPRPGGAGGAA